MLKPSVERERLDVVKPASGEKLRCGMSAKDFQQCERQIDGSKGPCGEAAAIILPLDMINHLALIKKTSEIPPRARGYRNPVGMTLLLAR